MMADEIDNVIDLAAIAAKAKARAADVGGFDVTEDGIALAFAAEHKDSLRYDHTRGTWYRWTGAVWMIEETKLAFAWARASARRFTKDQIAAGKSGATLGKAATAAGVERLAQADREFAVTSSIWDPDPWLLGTPGGTVELRTGTLRPARQAEYITRTTAVTPAAAPQCPTWDKFLHDATGGDDGLIRFLRQWCGYMLTGDTREHALMFIYGPGGNGKGVFLHTVASVLAQYARNAPIDTFTASAGDKHPTDLAMLRGARMVAASETDEGKAWAEVRIKQLTGGDLISARFMRQDFFEFKPEFKLIVIGNHQPVLNNVDAAARRRFNIVPFDFVPPSPDRELEEKLHAEHAGILRWMIEGCLDWQKNGLVRPKVVLDATAEYFSEQDVIGQWIGDNCEIGPHAQDTTEDLYGDWCKYSASSSKKPGSKIAFSKELARRGFKRVDRLQTDRAGFIGIQFARRSLTKGRFDRDE